MCYSSITTSLRWQRHPARALFFLKRAVVIRSYPSRPLTYSRCVPVLLTTEQYTKSSSPLRVASQHRSYGMFYVVVTTTRTYPDLVRWKIVRVRFPGRLSAGRRRSPAQRARAQSHIVGVLPPLPRVDHEVAETGTRRRHGLHFPRFDRRGLNNGHQDSFGRVFEENNVRVLVVRHRVDVKTPYKASTQL